MKIRKVARVAGIRERERENVSKNGGSRCGIESRKSLKIGFYFEQHRESLEE